MSPSTEGRQRLIGGLLLAVVTFALFFPLLSHDFLNYDDDRYVTKNPFVSQGVTLHGVRVAFTKAYSSNWHPLTWVSHMLDCQFYGLKPAGHHLTNLLLHVANVLLLFALLQKMTGKPWRSFAVAGLFAWHPLHIESVAWVAERKDLLSTFFGLLSVLAYVRSVEWPQPNGSLARSRVGEARPQKAEDGGRRAEDRGRKTEGGDRRPEVRGQARGHVLALAFFAMSLMSKPMLVTLPFVLLLLDFWPLKRLRWAKVPGMEQQGTRGLGFLIREKALFFVLSGISCLTTFRVQSFSGAMTMSERVPLAGRMANAVVSYVRYLKQAVLPTDLAVFYPYTDSWHFYQVVGPILLLGLFSAVLIWQARRRPYFLMGWLWFLGTLVPVIGIVQVGAQALADRYTYIPLIGLFIAMVWGAADLFENWRLPKPAQVTALAALLAACILATKVQLPNWKNSRTLFAHALAVTKNNHIAHINFGVVLFEEGQIEEAGRHFAEAIRIDPSFFEAHSSLGKVYARQGKRAEAVAEYQAASLLAPANAEVQFDLGNALAAMDRLDEAAAHYDAALRGIPGEPKLHFNYGALLVRQGKIEAAIRSFRQAALLNPGFVEAHFQLANMLLRSGGFYEAMAEYQQALKLKPDLTEAEVGLGSVLEVVGRPDDAILHYSNALRLNLDSAHAHSNLGVALARQGKPAQAAEHFGAAVRLEPENADSHYNLGNALLALEQYGLASEQYSEVLRLNPQDSNARTKLTLCRVYQKKTEAAKP